MTAAEQRAWQETPAGQFQRQMGVTVTTDPAAVEQHVAEIRGIYRTRFGRELTEAELAKVRIGGEMRSQVVAGGRVFQTTHELAQAMNWGLTVPPRDHGIALLQDGEWTGDPEVVAAARAAEAQRARLAEAAGEAWASGPVVMRTVAGPTDE